MNKQPTNTVPGLAVSLMLEDNQIAGYLAKHPQDRAWVEQIVEQNLFRRLANCQQVPFEICACFPRCLCGWEGLRHSVTDLRGLGSDAVQKRLETEPTPPENGPQTPDPDKTPAMVMAKPRRPGKIWAVAKKL
jgi:hypothetical protein